MKLKDCKNKLDYNIDCPIKKAILTIAKDPDCYEVLDWDVHGEEVMVDPAGHHKVYGKVTLTIDLQSNLTFDKFKKLIKF